MFDTLNGQIEGLEAELVTLEKTIGQLRARQAELLARLDSYQVYLSNGDRGMEDWTASRLDVSSQTAHRLMVMAKDPDSFYLAGMKEGRWGLDRGSMLVKLAGAGAPTDVVSEAAEDYSLGRLWGLVEQYREVSPLTEQSSFESRYLVIQPWLDESAFKVSGLLSGADGELVDKALRSRADSFPTLPGQTQGQGQLLADALVSVCSDSLTGGSESNPDARAVTVAEVFVDAALAAPTYGEAGVNTSSGLRVGPSVLEEILCHGKVRVVYTDREQGPVAVTHQTETVPPSIRAWIWKRDQGTCSIEGCRSRNRLQIHHIRHQHHGGDHHPDNLILLCWYHHHIAIHGHGFRVDPKSPVHRRRLIPPWHDRGPPPLTPPLTSGRHDLRPAS